MRNATEGVPYSHDPRPGIVQGRIAAAVQRGNMTPQKYQLPIARRFLAELT